MKCEADERHANDADDDQEDDPFIAEGLTSSSKSDNITNVPLHSAPNQDRLQAGKARREVLKWALFCAKEKRQG